MRLDDFGIAPDKERIIRCLKGKKTDRIPYFENYIGEKIMFQFETIPGSKKVRGFFVKIYLKIFSILDHSFLLLFLPERIISLKNGEYIGRKF
ncbi:hypothetical protein LCGC14_2251460 [marine sediment metagenome]|uniref:Uncharacterized protein n=1 Tax=marine sediment metagenome TaxID=412755 RepID=A0A0F9D2T9_9ZZZZ